MALFRYRFLTWSSITSVTRCVIVGFLAINSSDAMSITAVSFRSNAALLTLSSAQIVVQSESLSRVRIPFTYLSLLQKMQDFGNTVVGFELFDSVELLRLDFLIGTKVDWGA